MKYTIKVQDSSGKAVKDVEIIGLDADKNPLYAEPTNKLYPIATISDQNGIGEVEADGLKYVKTATGQPVALKDIGYTVLTVGTGTPGGKGNTSTPATSGIGYYLKTYWYAFAALAVLIIAAFLWYRYAK